MMREVARSPYCQEARGNFRGVCPSKSGGMNASADCGTSLWSVAEKSIKDGMPEGMRSGFQGLSAAICAQACVAAGSDGKTTTYHPGQPGFACFCKPYFAVYRQIFAENFVKCGIFSRKPMGKRQNRALRDTKTPRFFGRNRTHPSACSSPQIPFHMKFARRQQNGSK